MYIYYLHNGCKSFFSNLNFIKHIIGNATPASKGYRSLRLTNTRLAFFYIQIASVLPMHGFNPGDNNANHTEGGWMDEPVGQRTPLKSPLSTTW